MRLDACCCFFDKEKEFLFHISCALPFRIQIVSNFLHGTADQVHHPFIILLLLLGLAFQTFQEGFSLTHDLYLTSMTYTAEVLVGSGDAVVKERQFLL